MLNLVTLQGIECVIWIGSPAFYFTGLSISMQFIVLRILFFFFFFFFCVLPFLVMIDKHRPLSVANIKQLIIFEFEEESC